MTPQITPTQKTPKCEAADRGTHAHLMETASNHQSTKPLSHVRTTASLRHKSDLQKTTSILDTKPHHIIPTRKTQKLYRTQETYLDP